MYFQSAGFLFLFLPVFLVILKLSPQGISRKCALIIFSYLFYSGGEPFFVFLLVFSSGIDYTAALRIHGTQSRFSKRLWLFLSICVNLGLLAFYKYGGLILSFLDQLHVGIPTIIPAQSFYKTFVLPAGISFYTFQSMSYSIDVYRGTTKPTRDLLGFFSYVAYLPQLIAGPIERFNNLFPQIEAFANRSISGRPYWSFGLDRLCLGIAQKLFIADSCGRIVDNLMLYPQVSYNLLSGWMVAFGFGLQIYYDFAAYTSMAIGVSLLLGIQLSENFLSPYKALNIRDFWHRWHITLSSWLRDYLYIPLGGSRRGVVRTILNILVTFSLCGLWHGAGLNFIIWGLLHGILLAAYFIYRKTAPNLNFPNLISLLFTFLAVSAIWVPFRASDPTQIINIWGGMFGFSTDPWRSVSLPDIIFIGVILVATLTLPNCKTRWPGSSGFVESFLIWAIAIFAIFNSPQVHQFIYFQF